MTSYNKTFLILLLVSIFTLIPVKMNLNAQPIHEMPTVVVTAYALAGDCDIEPIPWLDSIGIPDGLLIPCECTKGTGEGCDFNSIVQMIANFSQLILGVIGSLALLIFIYGGVMFIIAEGKEERITKAKDILKNAAIGILIVFTAWIIVNVVIAALTGKSIGAPATLFDGLPWNQPIIEIGSEPLPQGPAKGYWELTP